MSLDGPDISCNDISKATPAPWAAGAGVFSMDGIDAWHYGIFANRDDQPAIGLTGEAGAGDDEESIANAHLMAAAPEMYAALLTVTAELKQLHSFHYQKCEGGCPADDVIKNAEAAIAKAEGR